MARSRHTREQKRMSCAIKCADSKVSTAPQPSHRGRNGAAVARSQRQQHAHMGFFWGGDQIFVPGVHSHGGEIFGLSMRAGIVVYPRLLDPVLSCTIARYLHEYMAEGYSNVFNPDNKRIQKRIAPDDDVYKYVEARLVEKGLLRGRVLSEVNAISSMAGCGAQPLHCDYEPIAIAKLRIKPLGVLIALTGGTRLNICTRHLEVNAGDAIVFAGDVVHGGASYAEDNVRIHAYLDVPTHARIANQSFLHVP